MITSADIKKAIINKLKTTFGYKVNSKMIQKGFERPSFFVEFDNEKRFGYLSQVENSKTVRIYYFPTDAKDVEFELLEMKDRLGDTFDLKITVKDRHLDIMEVTSTDTDDVLQFEFDIHFFDGREYENEDIGIEDEIKNGKDFYEKYPIELMGELVEEGD